MLFYLLGLGLLLLPVGQTAEGIGLTINQVNDSAYPQVELFFSVSDQQGVPIEGLTADAFQLFQEGSQIDDFAISAVDETNQGISIILVLDTSGSMGTQDEAGVSFLDLAQEAILVLVNSLDQSKDQAALIDFNSEVMVRQPFTSDFAELTQAFEALTAGQNTRLNDAAYEATVMAANLPPGRKAIVLLTDGQDTESRLTLDDAIDKAQESDVPFYTVGLGTGVDAQPLERLAILTGGRYLASPTVDVLEAQFATIAGQLRQQYVLTFEADVPADGRRHEFSLRAAYEGAADEDAHSFVARPQPGAVTITAPESGQEVAGSTTISPTFEMPGQVAQVVFSVDERPLETKINPPFIFVWESSTVEVGDHVIGLTVRDHVGNQAETSTLVTVVPLLRATLISPVDNQEISEAVTLEVVVDNVFYSVERVEFSVDGAVIDTLRTPPYQTVWDTADYEPGTHVILATVYDDQGNQQEMSAEIALSAPPQAGSLPTATALPARPTSRPQPAAQADETEPLAGNLPFPILFILLGVVLIGLLGAFLGFVLWRRLRGANRVSDRTYHDEVDDFERRVMQEAKVYGKIRPDTPAAAETQTVTTNPNSSTVPQFSVEEESSSEEDNVNVTQILNRQPAGDDAATLAVKEQAYFLVTHAGMSKTHLYPIKENEIIIGRAKDADIVLIDMAVSRHHATVRREKGQFTYSDLEPTNPSFINGKVYTKPFLVEDGDEIIVGETRLVFKDSI